ncbi:MAG: hypothetical protein J6M62_08780, partial [Selenomonadaceae bacterium]|nr:hypothetical protein [Selenomonadaceae bacterium]
ISWLLKKFETTQMFVVRFAPSVGQTRTAARPAPLPMRDCAFYENGETLLSIVTSLHRAYKKPKSTPPK